MARASVKFFALFSSFPLASRFLAIVVVPLLAASVWTWSSLKASLPQTANLQISRGQLSRGATAPATIRRDADGMVHIQAASDDDAFFAVGYAQAQDRLWQLELQRRLARGRVSEIFGKDSVDTDVWFRTLGLYESTATAWPALSPQAQRSLTAYTAGINAWIGEGHPLPSEFRVFGIAPERWTERDSLAWIKMFALDLGGNFQRELARYVAQRGLDETQLKPFFPDYPADAPTTVAALGARNAAPLASIGRLQSQLQRDYGLTVPNTGSNAWVVAGRLTADGAALLANDPHLGLQIPSLWYPLSIQAPGLKTSGMSLVGLPVVVFGRNERLAWGGTNMMADTQDLFFERVDRGSEHYETGAGWQAFAVREERIEVRADFPRQLREQYAPVALKVRSTRHGPIISDRYGVFDQPVALRWTGLDPGDTSYEAFFRLGYAKDWDGFRQALAFHVAPAMNMVYADREGNIGYLGAGRLPLRKQGEGTLPSPGWDEAYGWSGEVPPAQWPQSYNPPSGYIVTANNKVAGDGYPYFVSHDWASPARARRIEHLLRERIDTGKRLGVADMQRIQADTLDLEAAALIGELRKRLSKLSDGRLSDSRLSDSNAPDKMGEHRAQAARHLKDWNGDMRADSQAAAIFHAWMRHFRERVYADRLQANWGETEGEDVLDGLVEGVGLDQLTALLRADGAGWCDRPATAARETCDQALAASQERALWELYKLKGDWSMDSWRWGEVQHTVYRHTPFSQWKPFDKLFERRVGNGGSPNSVNVAGAAYAGSDGYLQAFGAGFRQVIALRRDAVQHHYMNSTGQSGNVFSPHYDDSVEAFRNVEYRRLEASYDRPAAAPRAGRATGAAE